MKYLLPAFFLVWPFALKAQFVVGGLGMTIQNGATFTVDRLMMQPAVDLNIQNNQLQRNSVSVPLGNGNSMERVYHFTNPITYSGTIGFVYNDTELAGNIESSLNLIYSSAISGNVWIVSSGSTTNTIANNISGPVSAVLIARLTAGPTQPLPIGLHEFTARKDAPGQAALLNWIIASEKDIQSYTVERSLDGKVFSAIGNVPAIASSTYQLIDTDPETGKNYYRLKMNDLTGSYSYSQIRVLNFEKAGAVFELYPNPVKNENITIVVHEKVSQKRSAIILDISGRVIQAFNLEGTKTQISVSGLQAGTYLIQIENEAVFKFIKQ